MRRPADVAHRLFRFIRKRIRFRSHLRSFRAYDEPQTLVSSRHYFKMDLNLGAAG